MDVKEFTNDFNKLANEFSVTAFTVYIAITKRQAPNSYWGLDFLLVKQSFSVNKKEKELFNHKLFRVFEFQISKDELAEFIQLLEQQSQKVTKAGENIANSFKEQNQVHWKNLSFFVNRVVWHDPIFIRAQPTHYFLRIDTAVRDAERAELENETCHFETQIQVINELFGLDFNCPSMLPWYGIQIYPGVAKVRVPFRLWHLGLVIVTGIKEKGIKLRYRIGNTSKTKPARLINIFLNMNCIYHLDLLNKRNFHLDAYTRYQDAVLFDKKAKIGTRLKSALQVTIPLFIFAFAAILNQKPEYNLYIGGIALFLSILFLVIVLASRTD